MKQFTSLEQLQNINETLAGQDEGKTDLNATFANNLLTSLVGKEVEVPMNQVFMEVMKPLFHTTWVGEHKVPA